MISFLSTIAEHYIIVLFLLANLAVSFLAHTKNKTNNFEDYALASRSLPTGVLIMTLLGTFLSTGSFAFVGWIVKYGVLLFIPIFLMLLLCWIIGTFFAPYLTYFQNMTTTGDLMGLFYGRFAQMVTAVFGGIFSIIFISGQLKAIGQISAHFLKIDPLIAIVCFGIFIVFYSIWGGMRAVSYTDVLQIVITMLMIITIGNIVMQKVGGIHMLFKKVPSSHTAFFSHPNFSVYLRWCCFGHLVPTVFLSPPLVQRMLVSDKRQVRKMWYIGSLFLLLIFIMLLCVTFSSFSMGVSVDVNDTKAITTLFLTMVNKLLTEKWLLHFVCISMLSVAISTLDSYFHTLGISMVQDLIVPLRSFWGMSPLSAKRKTRFSQYSIFLLGSVAILVSYLSGASLEFIFMFKFAKFFSPMVILPLVIGVVGIKTDKMSWLSFCVVYLTAMGILYPTEVLYNGQGGLHATAYFNDCFALSSLLAIVAFFITHIYINGGILILKRSKLTVAEQLWLPRWSDFRQKIASWIKAPLHLPTLASRKIVNHPAHSLSFSMLTFLLYTFSSVMTGGNNDLGLAHFMAGIHVVGITLCAGLMLEGIWSARIKPYFAMYWFFTLFYCLAFGSTLAFLRAHGDTMAVIKWFFSFMLLAFLVDSISFITLSCLGSGLAIALWYALFGSLPADLLESIGISGAYLLVGLLVIVVLFKSSKEQYTSQRFDWNRTASSALGHDLRLAVSMLGGTGRALNNAFKVSESMTNAKGEKGYWIPESQATFLENFSEKMIERGEMAGKEIQDFSDFIKSQVVGIFEQKKSNMHAAAEEAIHKLKDKMPSTFKMKISGKKDFSPKVLSGVFANVFYNLLWNAATHGKATEVEITIDSAKRIVTVRDNGNGIPSDVLPRIFDLNFSTEPKQSKNSGVGLAFVKMVVLASSGNIACHSRHGDKNSFTEFVMEFPEV